ncbi:cyanophycinase [Chryseobacterium sp. ISL-6]|uniref:cyanophycinase n=1 Tax=Chryseobacterium sp. ISL-6 TaxID=2819143 RepID=UPI001BE68A24|nr:cyanophycinase [Chryseobacterium sp. ISL-6]MBT2620116.1 cyanophycinase [Chryseobacterium sp. ISL-6]
MIPKGKLLIIGGQEDRNGTEVKMKDTNREFSPHEILKLLVQSKEDRIEVVTTASSEPEDMRKIYQKTFDEIGYTNFDFLHICDEQLHTDYHLKRISDAKTVFFTGGDQNRICEELKNSALNDLLIDRYHDDENFMIAGTSAGAMCMPEIIISDAENGEAMVDHDIQLGSGLGFINNCIIDTHFVHRGRFGRLAHAAILHQHHWGIGLGEDTALLIENGSKATCKGSGMVVIISAKNILQTNIDFVQKGDPVYAENLKVHLLTDNCCINLNDGKIKRVK